ncbi:biogenesis of lysosome-related organelles complex 1 subunit 4 isoform X1 [Monodelphis domestica]|uniref:biogenesis of lysosome-related organelles complex 1 subunit 4 isoform X1 n=1 Tax=Monodelphis domestica TaxID=13616 RepID=UPI0024E26D46|nr:biogenesis of lysosome-related organelles complex 1 subunit 4 isoform X1 [Monodelphis domestica]
MERGHAGLGPREGLAPEEELEPPGPAWSGDSGNVSQSHSSASGLWEEEDQEAALAEEGEDGERGVRRRSSWGREVATDAAGLDLSLLRRTAAGYATYLLPAAGEGGGPEMEALDKSLEDLLTRVDEFVGMLDMIRSDSSQVVNESVPHIHTKATEMSEIYRKIDKLEAFVKMIGSHVTKMEEQVTKAEAELGTFPNTLKKFLHTINVPSFLNKSYSTKQQQTVYEPPILFRTEDYFPCCKEGPQA